MAQEWSWRSKNCWQWTASKDSWHSTSWSISPQRSRSPPNLLHREGFRWKGHGQDTLKTAKDEHNGFPVIARLLSGRMISTVSLTGSSAISALRRSVTEALKSNADSGAAPSFDLVFNGRILADRELVSSVGLGNGAEVTVILAAPFKVLVAYEDRIARIFDGITGECERQFAGHRNALKTAQFSPDGSMVVTASDDFTVKVFAVRNGRCIDTIKQHRNNVNMASFSPDGAHILTASDDGTSRRICASTKDSLTYKGHRNVVNTAVFSPDGAFVLTASDDKTAKLFDSRTCQCIRTFAGHEGPVQSATFSPDASQLFTASSDGKAYIFDVKSGEQKLQLTHTEEVRAASFSPDGTKLVTVSWRVIVFSTETGARERVLLRRSAERDADEEKLEGVIDQDLVNSAVFSHDGDKVLTASDNGVVRLFNLATGECQRTYEATSSQRSCGAFSAVFAPVVA